MNRNQVLAMNNLGRTVRRKSDGATYKLERFNDAADQVTLRPTGTGKPVYKSTSRLWLDYELE